MSHTPGPWECTPSQIRDDLHWIARRGSCELTVKVEGSEANARLIAAAPDILAALEMAYDSLYDMCERAHELGINLGDDDLKAIGSARAAIAKAKGVA